MSLTVGRIFLGFLAGALSVLVVHQGMVLVLTNIGLVSWKPWSMAPTGPFGVPALANQMFWGGLWGAGFAAVWPRLPGRNWGVRGALYGAIGPLLLGRWLLVPLLKGEPVFAGLNGPVMLTQALIIPAFGAGLAWIYGNLAKPA